MPEDVDIYRRKAARERSARLEAESLLEQRSLQLYHESLIRERAERAERALRESEERYRLLVEQSPDAILIESEGAIVFANMAASLLFHAHRPDDLIGRSLPSLLVPEHRADAAEAMLDAARDGVCSTREQQAQRLDGQPLDVAATWIAFSYRGQPALQMVVRDISERKRLENQLSYQALHDALTGLPNRALFMEHVRHAIACARREEQRFVVCFIDLDRFKWINDSLGHEVGDELLKAVSGRMSAELRESDTVARLGGDEFVLLLRNTADGAAALGVINRVAQSVAEPLVINGHEMAVTCSVGCSSYPGDGQTAETLLRFADAAMYRAKESGRNKLQVYDEELRRCLDERVRLQEELRHALDRQQLHLEYQPQINVRNGEIIGVEALLRWQHPALGNVAPTRFIPLAEETGLIESIGAWAILRACRQAAEWQLAGLRPLRVAVNLSAKQLNRAGLEVQVARCLAETGLDPSCLELELTESSSMDAPEHMIPLMHRLKALGVSIAIDDFGTGFSNMHYLKRLPVDKLKLDGSFIREITSDPRSLAIVDAVISMAHRLGLKVVAEMVETEGQALLLGAHGCDLIQGCYFSPAIPARDCAALLAQGSLPLPQVLSRRSAHRTVLVVAEQTGVSRALQQLSGVDGPRILIAPDADAAFELMASHRVQVVIGSVSQPGLDGIEFLSKLRRMHPGALRLLLGERKDLEDIGLAINRGLAHRFLIQPWDAEELRRIVAEAFQDQEQRRYGTLSRPGDLVF